MAHLTVYHCDRVEKFVQKLADFQSSMYIILHDRVYEHVCTDHVQIGTSFSEVLKKWIF